MIYAFILGLSLILITGSCRTRDGASDDVSKKYAPPPPIQLISPPLESTSLEFVRKIKDNLESGNIVFNTPTKMKIKESKIIELLLSKNLSIQELQSSLKSGSNVKSSLIKISNLMNATLKGKGFEIEELSPEIQAISPDETITWKWQVIPTKDGDQSLVLTLSAIVNVGDKEAKLVIKTFVEKIKIEVAIDQNISDFLSNNWQWLWASILVPLSPFIWKYYQKRKTKNNPNNTIQ